ncbi:hypothetical protein AB0K02_00995 [Streptomyces sp. NPDC049597]
MTSMTHAHVRTARHRRSEAGRVFGERLSPGEAHAESRDRPTDAQLWS